MVQLQKSQLKVVKNAFCAVTVLKSNKIFIFGKNSLDIAGLIDSVINIGVPTSCTRALIG